MVHDVVDHVVVVDVMMIDVMHVMMMTIMEKVLNSVLKLCMYISDIHSIYLLYLRE